MSFLETVAKWGGLGAFVAAPDRVWRLLSAGAVQRVSLIGARNELPGFVGQYLSDVATLVWRPTGPFRASREFDRRLQDQADVAWEDLIAVPSLYLYRRAPVFFSPMRAKRLSYDSHDVLCCELSFPRGSLDVDALLQASLTYARDRAEKFGRSTRFRIINKRGLVAKFIEGNKNELTGQAAYSRTATLDVDAKSLSRLVGGTWEDMRPPTPGPAHAWMWWSPEATIIRNDALRWRQRQVWCAERGIPWRRAYLTYGGYGNGKSQTFVAVAQERDLPLYALNIASMSSDDFEDAFAVACGDSPAMVVIEDMHTVFKGSENIAVPKYGVSMATILNCLSGVNRYQGILVGFTTNDVSTMDPALCQPKGPEPHEVSRPDRVDLHIEFRNPSADGRRAIAMRILRDADLAERVVREADGGSIAEVQDLCYRLANSL